MWELALGTRLKHRSVFQDDERGVYLREALNLNLVRTSEYVKPYDSPDYINTEQDAALLEAIGEKHGEGRGFTWRDTGLHRVSDHGEVDLDPVDVDELSESEVAEVVRDSTYTWEFHNSQPEHRGDIDSAHTIGAGAIAGTGREAEERGPSQGNDAKTPFVRPSSSDYNLDIVKRDRIVGLVESEMADGTGYWSYSSGSPPLL